MSSRPFPRPGSSSILVLISCPAVCVFAWILWATLVADRTASARTSPGLSSRPDLVVVMLDDDAASHLQYLNGAPGGVRLLPTFRSHGIRHTAFLRYYDTTPLCCPSRASFLRGQYAHHTRILNNRESVPGALDGGANGFTLRGLDRRTIAVYLHRLGYRTIHVGKYFNLYGAVPNRPLGFVPPGWDEWRVFTSLGNGGYWDFQLSENGTIVNYPHQTDADYGTDVLRDKALAAIASTPPEQPLFLYFAPTAPHPDAIPAPRHQGLRPGLAAPRPPANPAYLEADVSDKCAYIQNLPLPPPDAQVQEEDAHFRNGANCLASVAEAIAAIVDSLSAAGRLSNTVFLITSDNGWSFFDHRWRAKRVPFEASTRTYLGVASANPALVPANQVRRDLAGNIDLAPTLAELAGSPLPQLPGLDGVSLVPMIRSAASPPVRTDLVLEGFGPESTPDPQYPADFPAWRALVTGTGNAYPNWKYIDYLDGHVELYDLTADPFEMTSVADVPANQAVRSAMAARLAELLSQ